KRQVRQGDVAAGTRDASLAEINDEIIDLIGRRLWGRRGRFVAFCPRDHVSGWAHTARECRHDLTPERALTRLGRAAGPTGGNTPGGPAVDSYLQRDAH